MIPPGVTPLYKLPPSGAAPLSGGETLPAAGAASLAAERLRAERAEHQLREMQWLLQMASQMGRLGAWNYVVGEARATWSRELCAIHQLPAGATPTPEEALAFFAPEYRESMAAAISKCLLDGTPFDVETEIITAQAVRIWIRAIGEAEWDEHGRVCRLRGAMQDISETRRAADGELRMAEQLAAELARSVSERTTQLEAANRELEAFSYSIAHDLRAPLGSIDGFSVVLERTAGDALPEQSRHYLARIRAGVRQMADLTDALLLLATLSRTSLLLTPVDLAALANAAVSACREQSGSRQVAVSIAHAMPAYGDERLLTQVMNQLVGNAWKFSSRNPDAKIEIGIKDVGGEGAQGEVTYFVRDNGEGFDMGYASKMFEPFHRLHAQAAYEGTGMGLAIVRKVVTRHGGRVWAGSAPGEGASFYFTLGKPGTPSSSIALAT